MIVCTQYKVITASLLVPNKEKTIFLPDEGEFYMSSKKEASKFQPIAGWRVKSYNSWMYEFEVLKQVNYHYPKPWMNQEEVLKHPQFNSMADVILYGSPTTLEEKVIKKSDRFMDLTQPAVNYPAGIL
jgi:hypothetical protein